MKPARDRGSAAGRNRYADLLRVVAIAAVVVGHWLLTTITYRGAQLSGLDAIRYVSWAGWVTLGFQVMPVFFLVGGYVHAISWTGHHERGEAWAGWVRDRAMGLLWPTTVYVAVIILAVAVAEVAGAGPAELAEAGWLVALQLWFLPVYLLLIALTPAMLAAHRRWGLAVPAVMAAGAAAVDAGVVGYHLPVIGYANYLLVWGSIYQCGFAWRDGTLTRPRWRPYALAAAGAAALAGLVALGPFPVDMIGAGERVGNTTPPSIALLAYAAAQTGLVLAAAPAVSRLLARPRWWRPVTRLTPAVMLVYLWHMVPVVIAAVAFYPTGVMPQPRIGSAEWWELRPAWIALLAAIGVPLIAGLLWLHRPLLRVLPTGLGPGRPWPPAILAAGLAAAAFGLTRLAIAGFAPGGRLPALVLGAYACGLLLTLLSGRPPPEHGPRPHEPGAAPRRAGPGAPASPVPAPRVSFGIWTARRPSWSGVDPLLIPQDPVRTQESQLKARMAGFPAPTGWLRYETRGPGSPWSRTGRGARNGSHRIQAPSDSPRPTQTVAAGEWLPARLPPTQIDGPDPHGMQEVWGSNPHSSTSRCFPCSGPC